MTITVTNLSSRSFIFGDLMILPKIPMEIDEEAKGVIDRSPYAEFFVYDITEDPPDTDVGGLRQEYEQEQDGGMRINTRQERE